MCPIGISHEDRNSRIVGLTRLYARVWSLVCKIKLLWHNIREVELCSCVRLRGVKALSFAIAARNPSRHVKFCFWRDRLRQDIKG